MTNPAPGLALAVIGNPPPRKEVPRMARRRRSRTAKAKPAAKAAAKPAPKPAARVAAPVAKPKTKTITAHTVRTVAVNPRRRRMKRNPMAAAAGGIVADFKGMPGALAEAGRSPMSAVVYIGGGFLGTGLAGAFALPLVAKVIPRPSPLVARLAGAGTHAALAVALSRLVKDQNKRRMALAGGIAAALVEFARPGAASALVARLPLVGGLVPRPAVVRQSAPATAAGVSDLADLAGDEGDAEGMADLVIPAEGMADLVIPTGDGE